MSLDLRGEDWRLQTESYRLHLDWWGKCRTCRFWEHVKNPNNNLLLGACGSENGPLRGEETSSDGHCIRWDTFDIDTALQIMAEDEERERR